MPRMFCWKSSMAQVSRAPKLVLKPSAGTRGKILVPGGRHGRPQKFSHLLGLHDTDFSLILSSSARWEKRCFVIFTFLEFSIIDCHDPPQVGTLNYSKFLLHQAFFFQEENLRSLNQTKKEKIFQNFILSDLAAYVRMF